MRSINSRFDQKGFKACGGQSFNDELTKVCDFFYDDFNKDELDAELLTLQKLYQSAIGNEVPSVSSIKAACTKRNSIYNTINPYSTRNFNRMHTYTLEGIYK